MSGLLKNPPIREDGLAATQARSDRTWRTIEPETSLASRRSELKIDKGGLRAGLQNHQGCHRTVQIGIGAVQRPFEQRAGNQMLDDDRQGIEQRKIVEQLWWVRVRAQRKHAGEIADSVIEVRQLGENP